MGFSRQEYWSGLPFSFPGDLPNSEIKPGSPALQADSLPTELQGKSQNTLMKSKTEKKKKRTPVLDCYTRFIREVVVRAVYTGEKPDFITDTVISKH